MKTCNKAKQRGDRHRTAISFYNDCIKDNLLTFKEAVELTWDYQTKYIKLLESKIKSFDNSITILLESCNDFYSDHIAFDYTITLQEAVNLAWDYLDKCIKLLEGRLSYFRKLV